MTFLKRKWVDVFVFIIQMQIFFLRKKYDFINYKPFGGLHHFLYYKVQYKNNISSNYINQINQCIFFKFTPMKPESIFMFPSSFFFGEYRIFERNYKAALNSHFDICLFNLTTPTTRFMFEANLLGTNFLIGIVGSIDSPNN